MTHDSKLAANIYVSYVWSEDIRETAAALLAHFEERNDLEGLESAYVMWDQFCVNHHSETGYSSWDDAIKCRDTLAVGTRVFHRNEDPSLMPRPTTHRRWATPGTRPP